MTGRERPSVSCVIPAFNEEGRIGATLAAVAGAGPCIAEVVVVDDGSTDGTRGAVAAFPAARLIANPRNLGKAASIARGIEAVSGTHVLLLDADLAGLESAHIQALIQPVLDGRVDVTLSMRENSPAWMKRTGVDLMCGERVLPRRVLDPALPAMAQLPGFGLEVFLNRLIIQHQLRLASVRLAGVRNDFKWKKRGLWRGIGNEIRMWRELLSTVSLLEFVRQNFALRALASPSR